MAIIDCASNIAIECSHLYTIKVNLPNPEPVKLS